MSEPPSFTCPKCGMTSHNPHDIEQRYCGNCCWWTDDPVLGGRHFGYPEDYRDPEYDGTVAGFRDVVLPARVKALEKSLNESFADLLPPGTRFEMRPRGG